MKCIKICGQLGTRVGWLLEDHYKEREVFEFFLKFDNKENFFLCLYGCKSLVTLKVQAI